MILYTEDNIITYKDFGILIPVNPSRRTKTFDFLNKHPIISTQMHILHSEIEPGLITKKDLLRVHSDKYISQIFSDDIEKIIFKTYGLIDENGNYHRYDPSIAKKPLSKLFDIIMDIISGTYQSCKIALEEDFCFYFSGGMHHAQKDFGNGFCIVNDIVIAISKLQSEKIIKNAWVIDVDVHKGDGTAALTRDDDSITTFSIHMAKGWPLNMPKRNEYGDPNPSFIPSTIDIPIKIGQENIYNKKLKEGLDKLSGFPKPDLAIVVSGADPYEKDELQSSQDIQLTKEQMLERDKLVFNFLEELNIPKTYLMAGGYGDNTWKMYSQFLEWVFTRT